MQAMKNHFCQKAPLLLRLLGKQLDHKTNLIFAMDEQNLDEMEGSTPTNKDSSKNAIGNIPRTDDCSRKM